MRHSESLKDLATALAAAQGEMENADKNAANPHFKSRYADLAEILNTVRPTLAKHGLSVTQLPRYEDGVVTVDTMLLHTSGEWLAGETSAPCGKLDPQGVGSATTYLRRYSLAAICGIAQEDDDAQGVPAGQATQRESRPNGNGKPQPKDPDAAATVNQLKLIENLTRSSVLTDDEGRGIQRRIEKGMTKQQASDAIGWLQSTIAERKASDEAAANEPVPAGAGAAEDPGLPF